MDENGNKQVDNDCNKNVYEDCNDDKSEVSSGANICTEIFFIDAS